MTQVAMQKKLYPTLVGELAVADTRRPYGDIVRYGADPLGALDSYPAIASALTNQLVTKYPATIPVGDFKITQAPTVGDSQSLLGQGYRSNLVPTGFAGPAVKVGTQSRVLQAISYFDVGNFRISGAATEGMRVKGGQIGSLRKVWLQGFVGVNGFVFDTVWGSSLKDLSCNGAVLSNACFVTGENYNANDADNWYTSNFCVYNVLVDAKFEVGSGVASGSKWGTVSCQGGNIGLYIKQYQGATFASVRTENVRLPVKLGNFATLDLATGVKINGGDLGGPFSSHPDIAARVACIDFNYVYGFSADGLTFSGAFNCGTWAPVSFTGGGGGAGARAIARVTPAGVVSSIEVINQGAGYTLVPNVVIGGAGAGAVATATVVGNAVTSIAVNNGGAGYALAGGLPVAITYTVCGKCSIGGSFFNSGLGINSSLYPWLVRSATADSGAAVTLNDDQSWRNSDNGNAAQLRKTRAFGFKHALIEYDTAAALVTSLYTPPVFP